MLNKLTERDELMIQRCLDDELSAGDTQQLLARLNVVTDGWKRLACGFLEERLIARGVRSVADRSESLGLSSGARDVMPAVAGMKPRKPVPVAAGRRVKHWWSHPVTSLSLCAAIAFVSGMLMPDRGQDGALPSRSGGAGSELAASPRSVRGVSEPVQSVAPLESGSQPRGILAGDYRVQFVPDGEAQGRTIEIPVASNMDEVFRAVQRQRLLSQQMLEQTPELRQAGGDAALRAVRVPLNDKNDLLMFVDDHRFGLSAQ